MMPACTGTTMVVACGGVAAMRDASGLCSFLPFTFETKGRRADKRKSYGSATLGKRIAAAPLGAPHALILVRYRASRYLSAWSRHAEHVALRGRLCGSGPRFRRACPAAVLFCPSASRFSAPKAQDERGDGRRLAWTARSSASSWQGLVLGPSGAPLPPECPAASPGPRAPHPVPHFTNASRKRPSIRTRRPECKGGVEGRG